jgi:hypothetical protein
LHDEARVGEWDDVLKEVMLGIELLEEVEVFYLA